MRQGISSISPISSLFARPGAARARCARLPANGPISRMRSAGARAISQRIGLGELLAENAAKIGTEIVEPGTAARPGADGGSRAGARPSSRHAGCRIADRRARRRHRHARRPRLRGRGSRHDRPPRLHHGNLGLHHGDDRGAVLRAGRLGPVFLGDDPGALAQRRRPIRGGRRDRPSRAITSRPCARGSGGASCGPKPSRFSRAARRRALRRAPARPRSSRAISMCFRNSSATARLMPIPTHEP